MATPKDRYKLKHGKNTIRKFLVYIDARYYLTSSGLLMKKGEAEKFSPLSPRRTWVTIGAILGLPLLLLLLIVLATLLKYK